MDDSNPASNNPQSLPRCAVQRRPRVLLSACGCNEATKFGVLCQEFSAWARVGVVFTNATRPFINPAAIPSLVVGGETVTEYLEWADVMVIAPLRADTLEKVIKPIN